MMRGGWWTRALARQVLRSARGGVAAAGARPLALAAPQLPSLLALQSAGLATHAGGERRSPPSFAIAEAFDGLDDKDDGDDDDEEEGDGLHRKRRGRNSSGDGDGSADDAGRPSREFLQAVEKKKRWMQTLAQQRDFASLVKSVFDCYAPLYAQNPALLQAVAPQLPPLFDVASASTKYQPRLFSDPLTKATEQEALALLVVARQGRLAAAIFEHRRALAQQLQAAPMVIRGDGSVLDDVALDLTSHFRSFYSWGMGAYSLLNAHDQIIALYEEVVTSGRVYPTANMNASYLKTLVSVRRPASDVRAFYNDVVKHNRPTNIFFYRQMLFFASVQHDVGLLLQLFDDMKMKGFKLRADDYLNAIKTFDDRYYFTPRKAAAAATRESKFTTPLDTYASCVARISEQEDHPEQFQELDDAASSVVTLFEEMVDEERLAPTSEHFFPRVISAAVYAREFDKAVAFLELFDKHFGSGEGEPTKLHNAGVRMAVNAFLLLDQPEHAWALVHQSFPRLEPRDFAHVANIVEYLSMKRDGARLVALLGDAKEMQILPLFSNSTVKILLPALVRDVDGVPDELLWDTVCLFEKVFQVRSKPHAYSQFLNECVYRKRYALAKRVLKQRDERRVGSIKARLALRMVHAFAAAEDLAAVPEVLKAVDFNSAKPDEVAEVCYAVIRANRSLGRDDEDSKRVFAKHLQPLVASGELVNIPEDIRSSGV